MLHRCEMCGLVAKYKCLHTGDKLFDCKHCKKQFALKQSIMLHLKVHVDEFLLSCSTCSHGIDVEFKKKSHEIDCTVRRYLCKASFDLFKSQIMRHMTVHSGETEFECPQCLKKLKTKIALNNHMKIHSSSQFKVRVVANHSHERMRERYTN